MHGLCQCQTCAAKHAILDAVQVIQALQPLAQREVLRFEVAKQRALAFQVGGQN